MNMPLITVIFAVLMILLGIIGYVASGAESATALIPTLFGLILLILGILGYKPHLRKRVMHAAALLGLIGFIATISASADLVTVLTGGEVARAGAVISKSIMSIISLAYFIVCLLSFVMARVVGPTESGGDNQSA